MYKWLIFISNEKKNLAGGKKGSGVNDVPLPLRKNK
jgi:hypothetical protein